jgi:hypothetical protein
MKKAKKRKKMSIPVANIPIKSLMSQEETKFCSGNSRSYEELLTCIKNYVGADCWAVTVNDEIVFNSYPREDKPRSIKEEIENDMIRHAILKNPHSSVLVHIMRRRLPTTIKIHMFCINGYVLVINYLPTQEDQANSVDYTIEFFRTEGFKE